MNENRASSTRAENRLALTEQERDRLVCAIDSAIALNRYDQYQAWLNGPFRELLPYEQVACVEQRDEGGAQSVNDLNHGSADTDTALYSAVQLLALRLADTYRNDRRQTCTLDADAVEAVLDADRRQRDHWLPHNAVIHRVRLLSGVSYSLILFNVPQDRLDRYRLLFRVIAAHLKMALSKALLKQARADVAPLTARELEILQWMREGKSNREISEILGISTLTQKHHVSKLYRKLDVQSRAEAVSRGLVTPGTAVRNNQ